MCLQVSAIIQDGRGRFLMSFGTTPQQSCFNNSDKGYR